MIIAIDGPSGAGKSTLGKMLAKKYGLLYIDTGAMYRAVALAAAMNGPNPEDAEAAANIAENCRIELQGEPDNLRVYLDGRDVTEKIRTREIARLASIVSTYSDVRRRMVELQREIGRSSPSGCVLEGRDIGTVVFPDADFKFFLTAKPEARARRRYREDIARGISVTYEETLAEINARDARDVSRKDSPLSIPDNAIVLDTSDMSLEEVFETMVAKIEENKPLGAAKI
jgi:cytidylate kinase